MRGLSRENRDRSETSDLFLSKQLDEHMKKLFILDKKYDEDAREKITLRKP